MRDAKVFALSRGYGKNGAEVWMGMGKTACLRFSSSTSLFSTGNSICISRHFPRIFSGKTVLLISVGHRLGRMGKPALSAGIRGYLSQIVELSSSMPIYVLALTWLTYFNDFICQSAVHFSVRQGVCSIFALRLKWIESSALRICAISPRAAITLPSLFIY